MLFIRLRLKLIKLLARLGWTEGVYYINGPDVLPAALSRDEEHELMERFVRGDITVREELIVHNLRLVVYIPFQDYFPKVDFSYL